VLERAKSKGGKSGRWVANTPDTRNVEHRPATFGKMPPPGFFTANYFLR
jgi:hypothetical protein